VRIVKLCIQQDELVFQQMCHQMDERNLGRVGRARKHAFTEEGTAQGDAIQAAHELIALPAFYRVRVSFAMKRAVKIQDRRIDPGAFAALCAFGAHLHHPCERLIDCHAKRVLLHFAKQAPGHMKSFERNDPPHVRIDQKQIRIVACIAHRKNPATIAGEQVR
tara:strand:- start:901 stop:1389 length:489 start_codon:yes stop_codon:yes gene_type:complete